MNDFRLIPDDTECEKVNRLSPDAEVFYRRLRLKSDDYGRSLNNTQWLKSKLYPLKDYIRATHISRCLDECRKAGLLHWYVDEQSRSVIELFNARQRKGKMVARFNPPEGQMPLLVDPPPKPPPNRNRSEVKRSEGPAATPPRAPEESGCKDLRPEPLPERSVWPPSWEEVKTYAQMQAIPEASAQKFFDHHTNENLWFNRHEKLINWQPKLKSWAEEDRGKSYEKHANTGGKRNDRNAGTANAGRSGSYVGFTKD